MGPPVCLVSDSGGLSKAPKDVHVLAPKSCEHVTLRGRRDVVAVASEAPGDRESPPHCLGGPSGGIRAPAPEGGQGCRKRRRADPQGTEWGRRGARVPLAATQLWEEETPPFVTAWLDLHGSMLSETSPFKKHTHNKLINTESRLVAARGGGA